jgi:phosphoribosyl-AMP cyclohydrolase / phosphoribosyl-ATP pyrophosphohydrolase
VIISAPAQLDALDFARCGGLLPVVAQHAHTGEVLMLAYADRAALEHTLAEGVMWYYSRSRARLWRKGDTSGNVQRLVALHADCDADAVVARVVPAGPACHTGEWSCFGAAPTLARLDGVIAARAGGAQTGGYTQRLLTDANLRLKKLGEEAVELALACARGDAARVAEEAADLLYHAAVACRAAGVPLADVLAVLEARAGCGEARSGTAGRAERSAVARPRARPALEKEPVQDQQDDGAEDGDAE